MKEDGLFGQDDTSQSTIGEGHLQRTAGRCFGLEKLDGLGRDGGEGTLLGLGSGLGRLEHPAAQLAAATHGRGLDWRNARLVWWALGPSRLMRLEMSKRSPPGGRPETDGAITPTGGRAGSGVQGAGVVARMAREWPMFDDCCDVDVTDWVFAPRYVGRIDVEAHF